MTQWVFYGKERSSKKYFIKREDFVSFQREEYTYVPNCEILASHEAIVPFVENMPSQ